MMKIKTIEHVEGLIMALLDKYNTDSRVNTYICNNMDNYSPYQLATLVDYLLPWSDKKTKKKVFKVLNKVRYIEDEIISFENIPCMPLNLPILYSVGDVISMNYYGEETLAVIAGLPNKNIKEFDFSDENYYVWVIPRDVSGFCRDIEFTAENLLKGFFHEHVHILDCENVYIDDLSRYGKVEWLKEYISICKQAIEKLEEK